MCDAGAGCCAAVKGGRRLRGSLDTCLGEEFADQLDVLLGPLVGSTRRIHIEIAKDPADLYFIDVRRSPDMALDLLTISPPATFIVTQTRVLGTNLLVRLTFFLALSSGLGAAYTLRLRKIWSIFFC